MSDKDILLAISMQYQEEVGDNKEKISTGVLLVDPIPNSQSLNH